MEKKRFLKLFLIAAVTIAIWNIPAPAGLEVETWHIVALYLGLLLGLVIKPFFRADHYSDYRGHRSHVHGYIHPVKGIRE